MKNLLLFFLLVNLSLFAQNESIKIGEIYWSTKNLDVDRFNNGDLIPEAKTNKEWIKAGEEGKPAWCYYDNNPKNGKIYGKLYNWYAVNDPRGLAPNGWHVPRDSEWTQLTDYLGENAGDKMKDTSGWEVDLGGGTVVIGNGTNISGFKGLPGGDRFAEGAFESLGNSGFWWTSTMELGSGAPTYRGLETDDNKCSESSVIPWFGFSVRCVKN
jgi:uncharacterized protein (TIGR02145 family)